MGFLSLNGKVKNDETAKGKDVLGSGSGIAEKSVRICPEK